MELVHVTFSSQLFERKWQVLPGLTFHCLILFFTLSCESKVVQLFKVYQKQGFQNVSHLNFMKFAVQDNELDLCLTGAVGEHLK